MSPFYHPYNGNEGILKMAKKTSATAKTRYEVYKKSNTWKLNREASLKRHLVKHPEDTIAIAALSALSSKTAPRRAGYKSTSAMPNSGRLYREQLAKVRRDHKTVYKGNASATDVYITE